MDILYKQIIMEESTLEKQINCLKERLKVYPEGILEISHSRGSTQYYIRDPSREGIRQKRKYVRKSDVNRAEILAQRDYEYKLLTDLETRLRAIRTVKKAYEKTCPEDVPLKYSTDRRKLIKPLILSNKEFADKWQAEVYEKKPFQENTPEIYTARGERVRSKSEKIIADTLYRSGIPYKYEYPLELDGFGLVHPDFLVLNPESRKEYFWEHLGMMDDDQYVRHALQKLHAYEKNDILPGRELIITSETKTLPLNNKILDNVVSKYLLCEE